MSCGGRVIRGVVLALIGVCGLCSYSWAAQLVLPASGPQEASLAGNAVALPLNASSALFHNPAQLTLLPNSATLGLLGIRYHSRYTNPLGYDNTSREFPVAPSIGYVTDRWAPFHVGIGVYGSLGFAYNFAADPTRGVPNNFYTDLLVISLAPAIAYSLTPEWHVGFSINPSYGRLRFKTPSPVGRIDVDTRGPGFFSTVGLMYTPTPRLDLGVGYKTPGMILMRGNARIGGRGDNAKVDFHLPQSLEFGAAYHFTDRLIVTTQGKWTDYTVFEDTRLEFEKNTFLNAPAVRDARSRLRVGAGVQYKLLPRVTLQSGFSWERWAIKASSLAPTLPSLTEYYLLNLGISIERGPWTFHLATGYAYAESRRVTAETNPFFPGRYSLQQAIFGIQLTRRFGEDQRVTATDERPALRQSVSDEEQSQKNRGLTNVVDVPPSRALLQSVSFNDQGPERNQGARALQQQAAVLADTASLPQDNGERERTQEASDRGQWARLCDVESYEGGCCAP